MLTRTHQDIPCNAQAARSPLSICCSLHSGQPRPGAMEAFWHARRIRKVTGTLETVAGPMMLTGSGVQDTGFDEQ